MPKTSLKQSNPYLKDPALRNALLFQSVASSTAVEGVLTKYPRLSRFLEKKLKRIIEEHDTSGSCG